MPVSLLSCDRSGKEGSFTFPLTRLTGNRKDGGPRKEPMTASLTCAFAVYYVVLPTATSLILFCRDQWYLSLLNSSWLIGMVLGECGGGRGSGTYTGRVSTDSWHSCDTSHFHFSTFQNIFTCAIYIPIHQTCLKCLLCARFSRHLKTYTGYSDDTQKKKFALMNWHAVEVIANVSHDALSGRLDQDPLVSFILRWRNQGSEKLNVLPEGTQLDSGRALGSQTPWILVYYSPYCTVLPWIYTMKIG